MPDDFEKMTTKKRIVQEGIWQKNCVVSYIADINADRCAIYSFVYDGKRYTVEFRKEDGHYYIRQLYGACNSKAPDKVWNAVKSYL